MVDLEEFIKNLWTNVKVNILSRDDLERAWKVLLRLEKRNCEARIITHKRYQMYYNRRLLGDGHMVALHAASIATTDKLPDIVFVSDEHA